MNENIDLTQDMTYSNNTHRYKNVYNHKVLPWEKGSSDKSVKLANNTFKLSSFIYNGDSYINWDRWMSNIAYTINGISNGSGYSDINYYSYNNSNWSSISTDNNITFSYTDTDIVDIDFNTKIV